MNVIAPWAAETRDERTLKRLFAAELLRYPNNPFQAGRVLFPNNHLFAITAAQQWVSDRYVLESQAELIAEFGEDYFLPSKVILARRIYDLGERESANTSERLAAYKLYAELRGFIQKSDTIVGANVTINQNRVMVVPSAGSDAEWEEKVGKQQMKLIEGARE